MKALARQTPSQDLARITEARKALERVRTVPEAIQFTAQADAILHYCKRAKLSVAMQNEAALLGVLSRRKAGDLIRHVRREQGKRSDKLGASGGTKLQELGIPKRTLSKWQGLAKNFTEDQIEKVAAVATEEGREFSSAHLLGVAKKASKDKARAERAARVAQTPPAEPGEAKALPQLIYADPPWQYDSATTSPDRVIENQYPTATLETIKAHRPESADDAVLLLWATAPLLLEALAVMAAWGFTYKTCAVWDKVKIGMGYWFRGQHELLLVGVKGKPERPDEEERVSSVFRSPRGKHSEKPASVAEWIERAFPFTTKLEMYARTRRPGWEVWGNEV